MKRNNLTATITALLFLLLVTGLIFFKIFLRGQYPVPGDLLVSFYFPWYSGGWEGYNPWTTHKELLGADAIRQIYLWKEFALNQIKGGQLPLWNPYTFSGQPLAANFQSSVYYPLNFFYFLIDAKNAWILLVVSQPFLAGLFMYMAARSFKLSQIASVFTAVAFMFSSYLVTWMENGNIAHSYIWLPLAFWAINNYFEKLRFRFLLVLIGAFTFSILAGHPQTAIYIYLAVIVYWLYKVWVTSNFRQIPILIIVLVAPLALSAIQLVPTFEFYKNSPISLPFSKEVFERGILPHKNLITFFASDFFGHPANNNFWSQTYGDFTPYFGVVPFIFALWSIFKLRDIKFIKFATFVAAFLILAAVHSPITWLIKTLQIPLLDSTTPARFISIAIFLFVILAGFGFENFLKNFQDKKYIENFVKFLMPLAGIYLGLWLITFIGQSVLEPQETWRINFSVSRRNLILPTTMFFSIPLGILVIRIIREKLGIEEYLAKPLLVVGIFIVMLTGGIYYTNKFLPVAPKKFIFPDHPLFYWLKNNAGVDRFYGGGTAHIDFNFPTHYQIFGAEGYDTLRLKRYAELLASSFGGKVPQSYLRSDGVFPTEENGYRKRLFELLGIKYLLDKEDNPKTGADWHYERFPNDNVEGFWQYDKFQVYVRKKVLPRTFLTTKYYIAKNDEEIIQKIYDSNFNLETLILEEEPSLKIIETTSKIAFPTMVKYQPNEVIFRTNLNDNAILFLSDAYDENWQVYLDGEKSKLLRAHYALRAVAVPAGSHLVTFKYAPKSFYLGALVSILSISSLAILSLNLARRRRF